jgi:hypothetical protein
LLAFLESLPDMLCSHSPTISPRSSSLEWSQGGSDGLLSSAAGASLLDHSLERHQSLAGIINGDIPGFALAMGALASGILVQFGPD